MGKKKRERAPETLAEYVGFKNIFQNDKVRFMSGAFMLLIALFLLIAFVSYFITGAADQSLVEDPRADELRTIDNDAQNYCGSIGSQISYYLINVCFGIPAFIIPLFIILAGLKLMRAYNVNLLKWFLNMVLVMVWCSVAMAKFATTFFADSHIVPGGNHGEFVRQWIESQIGEPGLLGILLIIALAYLTYLSSETIIVIRKILNPKAFLKKVDFKINVPEENSEEVSAIDTVEDPDTFDDPGTQTVEFPDDGKAVVNIPAAEDVGLVIDKTKEEESAGSKVLVNGKVAVPYDPKKDLENYHYPTLDLLKKYDNDGKPYIDMAEQTANKNRIVEVLRSFGVEIKTISATVGPTITLYEVTPAEGVRISKIRNLEDDIALSLSALGIRIIAPIPGKGTIGIEVPNAKPNIVSMESILNSKKFQETNMKLPIALGKTISNEVFMVDLAKIPHLLVAGATGQGKSVGLNAIITSLLYKKHPAELKFVLIDPKKVEFSIYRTIANHFLAKIPEEDDEPIITDVTKVVKTLNSLCKEMDERYNLLKVAGVRKVEEYNEKFKNRLLNPEHGHRYMPYIVVIIDEFGDLSMTAGKEIEMPISRIAQLARAVGIHMVIATQRPTTTIITGNIKANFPGRMAFKVSSMMDSRIILDRPGANQLIGRGDMLFLSGNEPIRVQCAFVDTPEVDRINKYISQQQGYPGPFELPEPDSPNDEGGMGAESMDLQHVDPLFEEAARLIVINQQGSTSLIQRKFAIGYNRAGRLMDQLEKAGIVGAAQGSKPREVMITDENSLEQLLSGIK